MCVCLFVEMGLWGLIFVSEFLVLYIVLVVFERDFCGCLVKV